MNTLMGLLAFMGEFLGSLIALGGALSEELSQGSKQRPLDAGSKAIVAVLLVVAVAALVFGYYLLSRT